MEQLIKGASRHYRINNDWLDTYSGNSERYVDLEEISKRPTSSQYLNDLVAMGVSIEFEVEARKASFWINGIRIGTAGNVRRIYIEDPITYINTGIYNGATIYPERFKRIYAQGTTARSIEFLGVGATN